MASLPIITGADATPLRLVPASNSIATLVATARTARSEQEDAWLRMDEAELGSVAYYAASLVSERAGRRLDNTRRDLAERFRAFLGNADANAFLEMVQ